MKTSNEGIDLIKRFEGFRGVAYKCPAGVWTIGWGTTRINGIPVRSGMTCTKAQATQYLKADLEKFEKNVMKYDSTYRWTQSQFDAMVSFAYNIGSIDRLVANGRRTKKEISEKILAYNKAGGKILAGLVTRRNAEKDLFDLNLNAKPSDYPVIKKGSKGDYVVLLKKSLNQYNYNLAEDGIFGYNTEQAVIAYQGLNNLVKDGIVGKKTWASLIK